MPSEQVIEDIGRGQEHSVDEDVKFISPTEEVTETDVDKDVEVDTKDKKVASPPKEEGPDEEKIEEEVKDVDDAGPRPSFQELKAKYPNIFKDFPGLRGVYFRERAYSEVFPTVDDAREAAENSDALVRVEESVTRGDVASLLDAAKEVDPKSVDRIANNFLSHLYQVSPDAHMRAVYPLIENVLRSAFHEGSSIGNDNLSNAALVLSHFLFGDQNIVKSSGNARREETSNNEELREIERARSGFELQKFQDAASSVRDDASTGLIELISEDLDPDSVMSDTLKQMVVDRVVDEVGRRLDADRDHISYMDSLWNRARKNGYSRESKSRIVTAYLERAKSLIPTVRNKLRSDVLKTSANSNSRKRERSEEASSRREVSPGRESKTSGEHLNPKAIDWRKTSDLDVIEGNVTFRR